MTQQSEGKLPVHDCCVVSYVVIQAHSRLWRSILSYRVLKYYFNVEYPPHRPHAKIDFFVRSVSFFLTARIFFANAPKN